MAESDISKFPTPEKFTPFTPRRNVVAGMNRDEFIKLTNDRAFAHSPMGKEMKREEDLIAKARAADPNYKGGAAVPRESNSTQLSAIEELDAPGPQPEPEPDPDEYENTPIANMGDCVSYAVDMAINDLKQLKNLYQGQTIPAFQACAKNALGAAVRLANTDKMTEAAAMVPNTVAQLILMNALYEYVRKADAEGKGQDARMLP